MNQPLKGIKVLDLSRLLPGPYCSMILCDFGATVICIEDKKFAGEPGMPCLSRGKKHINLNLKSSMGKEIFFKLTKEADVILEGFRPGTVNKLGVDYGAVKKIKPDIIYCSITGYGQDGPYSEMVGHDLNYIGFAGILESNAWPDEKPVHPSVQIADIAGGSLQAAIGILIALFEREKSGKGQYIDISMMDGGFALTPWMFSAMQLMGKNPDRENRTLLTGESPSYGVYKCKDNMFITLGAIEPRFWKKFCEKTGLNELIPLQYSANHWKKIEELLTLKFLEKTRDEWFDELKDIDVCIGKVKPYKEALSDPQLVARNMITEITNQKGKKIPLINQPIKLSRTPSKLGSYIPDFGQDTSDILMELGYSENEIDQFKHDGVI